MMCKNCGSNISSRESYCPNCGMELMVPYSKSLKEKYIAGEYSDRQEDYIPRNKRNQRENEMDYPDETDEAYHYENAPQEEYVTEESGTSLVLVLFLFLIIALLVGFIFGFAIFSGILHSLPGLSNLGV